MFWDLEMDIYLAEGGLDINQSGEHGVLVLEIDIGLKLGSLSGHANAGASFSARSRVQAVFPFG